MHGYLEVGVIFGQAIRGLKGLRDWWPQVCAPYHMEANEVNTSTKLRNVGAQYNVLISSI